jgi:hypothetical protein
VLKRKSVARRVRQELPQDRFPSPSAALVAIGYGIPKSAIAPMLVKITNARFGGIKRAVTADETGLAEGASFRLVSMTLPYHRAHLHAESGEPCATGYSADGRHKTTARLREVIAL